MPKSNVKLINSDDLELYGCPVDDTFVIVAKQSKIKFREDDVISSTQAEGIFHKIQDVTSTGRSNTCRPLLRISVAKQQFASLTKNHAKKLNCLTAVRHPAYYSY